MLIPREHGAYGQLAFPLITALAIGRPTGAAWALAAAGLAVFLGHESLLVVLGQRGLRAWREHRAAARRSLVVFGAVAAVSGVGALLLLTSTARIALVVPGVLSLALALLLAGGQERTTGGEILVATTLSSLSLPTAIAGGVSWPSALTVMLVFSQIFAAATIAVRAIIALATRGGGLPRIVAASIVLGTYLALAALGAIDVVQPGAAYAALPMSAVAMWLLVRPPSPRRLRVVGWTLVGSTTVTAVILVAALR